MPVTIDVDDTGISVKINSTKYTAKELEDLINYSLNNDKTELRADLLVAIETIERLKKRIEELEDEIRQMEGGSY